jgi:hypothetical protein
MPSWFVAPGSGRRRAVHVCHGLAERRCVTVHRHYWSLQPPKPLQLGVEGWVREEISPLLDAVATARC